MKLTVWCTVQNAYMHSNEMLIIFDGLCPVHDDGDHVVVEWDRCGQVTFKNPADCRRAFRVFKKGMKPVRYRDDFMFRVVKGEGSLTLEMADGEGVVLEKMPLQQAHTWLRKPGTEYERLTEWEA